MEATSSAANSFSGAPAPNYDDDMLNQMPDDSQRTEERPLKSEAPSGTFGSRQGNRFRFISHSQDNLDNDENRDASDMPDPYKNMIIAENNQLRKRIEDIEANFEQLLQITAEKQNNGGFTHDDLTDTGRLTPNDLQSGRKQRDVGRHSIGLTNRSCSFTAGKGTSRKQ